MIPKVKGLDFFWTMLKIASSQTHTAIGIQNGGAPE